MRSSALRLARYRFAVTFRRRLTASVVVVLMVGMIGGLAMAAIAGARRTQSSFSAFLASTDPSELSIAVFPDTPFNAYSPSFTRTISKLPHVEQVGAWEEPFGVPLERNGIPDLAVAGSVTPVATLDGESYSMDKPAILSGKMADPSSPNEFVTTEAGAEKAGWHVGEVIPFGFYSAPQIESPLLQSGRIRPAEMVDAKLVGLVQFSNAVVQDEVDRYPTFAMFTPALADRLINKDLGYDAFYYIRTDGGSSTVPAVEREISPITPRGVNIQTAITSIVESRANRAIRPESIALGAFGLIAALAALAIGAQAVARLLQLGTDDLVVLRSLGATPAETMADGLFGAVVTIVLGALLAVGVAVVLSPLAPIGPVRAVYPSPGLSVDWTVVGFGFTVLVVLLCALAVTMSFLSLPHRVEARRTKASRGPRLASIAATSGVPASAVTGVQFALERGSGRTSAPVRSVIFGTVLAVLVVATTLTFGSGLKTLVSHPNLYGWNWTYALGSETGPDVPNGVLPLLRHNPYVTSYSGASIADPQIDGQVIPSIFESIGSRVVPPILTGHVPESSDQIVLGDSTMAQLGVHVGEYVSVTYGSPKTEPIYVPPKRLLVVGTATFPALGFPTSEGNHTSMGVGALVPSELIPSNFEALLEGPVASIRGPEFVFVRMRPGLSTAKSQADIDRILSAGDRIYAGAPDGAGSGETVTSFYDLLPAEIVNYRSMGSTPTILAGSLALGTTFALGVTLIASVRRRRRDLALLKTLGFTGRQISVSVAVQATVVGLIGLLLGLPLGIIFGRWLWILFSHEIYAVPSPTVPVPAMVIVSIATLLIVNVVAVLPGRLAARTPAALVLRSE